MIRLDDCYKIGRIGKTHGVKGEVTLLFDDDIFDRVDADYLILEVDGILVPFFMDEYRFRSDTVCLVKFLDIDTQQRAQELTGCDVYFPRKLADEADDELSLAVLVGFTVTDADTGTAVGRIASIDDQTANILFCLDDGRLLPANSALVEHIDTDRHTIAMHLPDGLLDL